LCRFFAKNAVSSFLSERYSVLAEKGGLSGDAAIYCKIL